VTERNLAMHHERDDATAEERSGDRGREVGGAVIGNTATPSTMPNAARNQWQYCHNAAEASRPRSGALTITLTLL
jgi:hypothetical protein